MNFSAHIFISLVLGLSLGPVPGRCAQTNQLPAFPSPPPVLLRSPVDAFRTLLVMPSAERSTQLAVRPPEIRQRLLEKIREYQSLTPEERDLRLKATELQWYLKPLLTMTPTNRTAQLAGIPDNLRDMVTTRLQQWDALPPGIQRLMLTNQAGATYLVSGTATNNFPPMPPGLVHNRILDRYNRLFELTAAEKENVLSSLSETERRQMEKTLHAYARLNPQQRAQCVLLFAKFSGLPATERQEFLKNAERWAQMTPAERQSWRELVSTAPQIPPLPQLTIKRPPPFPPGLKNTPRNPTNNGG